ncbi:hypothetical protein BX666DRAFT_2143664 [Dichotomocladium elegans]|nr:hypothetical protein BX666DRAFT_2143664 [Dichotomocladium elegans]
MAKEDHIYRLNHVINTLFRFHLHQFDHLKVRRAVALANFLFDRVGLDHDILPRITSSDSYCHLIHLLQAPRPPKTKPTCKNCNTKPASRRSLCVACYRYELKHHEPRPLRLIIANRPGPRSIRHIPGSTSSSSVLFFDAAPPKKTKTCDNCSIQETHQWYRNLVGKGHWCETCKSYYLRHGKIRPPVLFVKAAKRKINVKTLVHYWNALPSPSNESLSSEELSPSPTSPPIALFPNDTLLTLPSWCLQ